MEKTDIKKLIQRRTFFQGSRCSLGLIVLKIHKQGNQKYKMIGQFSHLIQNHRNINSPTRMFVFDNENTYSSLSIEDNIDTNAQIVDISQVLVKFQQQRGGNEHYVYRIYSPTACQYVNVPETKLVPQEFFISPIVMIKYSKTTQESDAESSSSLMSTESKKQRNKQRTIREVIESVKKWREIHNSAALEKNRVSLQEAAKILGISKKSLDDYFYQLRLGQQFGFDFEKHMDSKVGVLRAFVRKHKPAKESAKDRRPRRLKLLEDMGMETQNRKQTYSFESEKRNGMEEEFVTQTIQSEGGGIVGDDAIENQKMEEQEKQFYDNFAFDDPYDMFVTFREKDFVEGDFHKKANDFEDLDLMPW